MNGRASRHNSAGVQLFKPVPSRRKSTINTEPPSTDNPSKCTASITGNSHSEPTTARPSHTVSHHSKKGSSIVSYSAGGTTQPANQLTNAGCGWMTLSNQL